MKSRLRRLIIDNEEYRWAYTTHILRPAMQTLISLRVWGQHKNNQMLVAAILVPSVGWIYLLPSDVRAIIIVGLAQGWQPHEPRAAMQLKAIDGMALACSGRFQILSDRERQARVSVQTPHSRDHSGSENGTDKSVCPTNELR